MVDTFGDITKVEAQGGPRCRIFQFLQTNLNSEKTLYFFSITCQDGT